MLIEDVLKRDAYPESEQWNRLRGYMLKRVLPVLNERFPAVQVIGSYPKGYADSKSDVDFKLYLWESSTQEGMDRYGLVRDILRNGGWKPCNTGHAFEYHHLVHLDSLEADKIKIPLLPRKIYSFLSEIDLAWLFGSTNKCMKLADVFAGGFVEHPSMEAYRRNIASDIKKNKNSERIWELADILYRQEISNVNLKRHNMSRQEKVSIKKIRRDKFGLPPLEYIINISSETG